MALHYDPIDKRVHCNVCRTQFNVVSHSPSRIAYKGQIFSTEDLHCPHCDRHPGFIVNDAAPEPPPKLKDWGAF